MTAATVWWLLAGAAVAAELITGTFYLLMLSIGLAAGALAAHAGLGLVGQLVAAAVVGGGAVVVWHRWRQMRPAEPAASANRDVNMDVGQSVVVTQWESDGTARVRYRGADWTAQLHPDAVSDAAEQPATPGPYRIVSVEGSRLLVRPAV